MEIQTNGVPWLVWFGKDMHDMRQWHCKGCGQFGCVPSYPNASRLAQELGDIKRAHASHRPSWWGTDLPDCPYGGCRRVEGQPCGHIGCPLNFGRIEP